MRREDDILSSLNKYFSYHDLRPGQLPVIRKILDGKDVLICKESGFGKSLCFQLPGLMMNGVVVIVSTFLSRIEEKCQNMSAHEKVKCAYLNSIVFTDVPSNSKDLRIVLVNKNKVWDDLRNIGTSGLKFLYVTLDYFVNSNRLKIMLKDIYRKNMLQAIVIDEVSYGVQWIDSFRRDYSELGSLRKTYPKTSFLCFTSPTSQSKLSIIKDTLHLNTPYILNEPSIRENVSYKVMYLDKELPMSKLADHIKKIYDKKSGLVYCFSKEECQLLVESLKKNNMSSIFYDKTLTDNEKEWLKWINQYGVIVVCLSGVPVDFNFQKVDFVLHVSIPIALDIYIKETSKVGNNGSQAECILLYCEKDCNSHLDSITASYKKKILSANTESKKLMFAELKDYRRELFEMTIYAENISICRQALLLKYLNDENVVESCGICDICEIMKKSFAVDMSAPLKKILIVIWSINRHQKGVKSDEFVFASIEHLLDLLLGVSAEHTDYLSNEWFFGSFQSWNQSMLRRLIFVLLNQKFASSNLIANNQYEVYQNLIITSKGQKFLESTNEFHIVFSCKDVLIGQWFDVEWVKNQFQKEVEINVNYHLKRNKLEISKNFISHLTSVLPSTWEDFKKIKYYHNVNKISELDKDLFEICLIYHRILESNYIFRH